MNGEQSSGWKPPLKANLQWIGIILIIVFIFAFLIMMTSNEMFISTASEFLFAYMEIISVACFIFLLILAIGSPPEQRPFFSVPWEGAWWEFIVFGMTRAGFALVYSISIIGSLIFLPLLVPLKVIYVYSLGPNASLFKAVAAIPIVIFTVSMAFTIIYATCILKEKGTLRDKGTNLYTDWRTHGIVHSIMSTFYFSVTTFLGGFATPYEPQGWCKWIALFQLVVGKVLEVVLVGIGIAIIITRMSPHP